MHMIPGRTGNDVLANATKAVKDAGLRGLIYSHPIGDYGHSAGSYIGTTGNQGRQLQSCAAADSADLR